MMISIIWKDFGQVWLVKKSCHTLYGLHLRYKFFCPIERLCCESADISGRWTENFRKVLMLLKNNPNTQNAYLEGCVFVQLSDLVELKFLCRHPFQKYVKDPSTMKNKYPQMARKNWYVQWKRSPNYPKLRRICRNSSFWVSWFRHQTSISNFPFVMEAQNQSQLSKTPCTVAKENSMTTCTGT